MPKKLYDLAVKTGKYFGRDGKEKGRWQNVGCVMEGDDGGKWILIHRWFAPAGVPDLTGRGGESVLLSMFAPRADTEDGVPTRQIHDDAPTPTPSPKAAAPVRGPSADEIPF